MDEITIGVDLGGTNVRAGLVENGKVVKYADARVPKTDNKDEVIDTIINVIDKVWDKRVSGIGIGVPGLTDNENGIIHSIVNIPSFTSVPMRQILDEKFNVPVALDNDVNCFALGEKYYGAGKEFRNVVGLSLGTGMGAGIISGEKLIEDANGGSGEFGEIPYLDSNFEAYCSGQFFTGEIGTPGEELFKRAEDGDAEAKKIFSQLGVHIGKAIKVIMLAIDPEAIILGGSVSKSHKYFHDAMIQEVNTFVYPESLKNFTITYASEKHSPILGAAKLVSMMETSVRA